MAGSGGAPMPRASGRALSPAFLEESVPRLSRVVRSALLCASVLPLPAAPLPAQENPVPAWEQKMTQAEQQIRQGEHKKAQRTLREVVGQMGETLGTGPAAAQLLGRATGWLALAEAGLDEMEAARWDWAVAGILWPAATAIDLAPYGEAGRRLAAAPAAPGPDAAAEGAELRPPSRKKGKAINYPISRLLACPEAAVEVSATVGVDGRPRQPRFSPAPDAVLAWAALETLRTWTFVPATSGGRPVEAPFTLKTDLSAKRCRDLLATRRPMRGGPDTAGSEDEE